MAFDFKAATEDTTIDANALLFGADSQSSSSPSIYKVSTLSALLFAGPTLTGVTAFPAGSAAAPSIIPTGDTNTGFWFPAADTIAASTGGTERVRVTALGQVNIGRTTAGIGNNNSTALTVSNGGATVYQSLVASGGEELYMFTTAGTAGVYTYSNIDLRFGTNNSEKMRINSAGNVGIGVVPSAWGSSFRALDIVQFGSRTAGFFGGPLRTGVGIALGCYNDNTNWLYSVTGAPVGTYEISGAGSHVFSVATGGTAGSAISFIPALTVTQTGNIHTPAGSTSMFNGFFYMPAAAGAPTGTPTSVTGTVPFYYDTTNNQFYVYNGSWKKVALA